MNAPWEIPTHVRWTDPGIPGLVTKIAMVGPWKLIVARRPDGLWDWEAQRTGPAESKGMCASEQAAKVAASHFAKSNLRRFNAEAARCRSGN